MRLHLVGLPHTSTTRAYNWCAFTALTRQFADMMTDRGHHVILYGGIDNEARCAEHVACVDEIPDGRLIPEYSAENPMFSAFNERAITEIRQRAEPRDFILLTGGCAQQPIRDAFPNHQVVEPIVGYGGPIRDTHHVYPSYAWMHTIAGNVADNPTGANGRFFDQVIPHYLDVDDFPAGRGDGGYLLYVGRLIERKGVQIAIDTARATGLPLKVAGMGDYPLPDWVDYHGVIGPEERAELMGGAIALIAPTTYVEPFGLVVVEAQCCGTPAITTDWGAFTETVQDGVTGFRCRTIAEFINAVELASGLDRDVIRQQAIGLYSTEAVAPQYERYFDRLTTLWHDGFYEMPVLSRFG